MSSPQHRQALERLLQEMEKIGEPPGEINDIIIEPKWSKYFPGEEEKPLCDLLFQYDDGLGGAIELKRTPDRAKKGRHQLRNGAYVLWTQGIYCVQKKLVYYSNLPIWTWEYV